MGGDGLTICNRNSLSGQVARENGDDSYLPKSEMKEQSCFFFLEEPVNSFTADLERTARCESWLQL